MYKKAKMVHGLSNDIGITFHDTFNHLDTVRKCDRQLLVKKSQFLHLNLHLNSPRSDFFTPAVPVTVTAGQTDRQTKSIAYAALA